MFKPLQFWLDDGSNSFQRHAALERLCPAQQVCIRYLCVVYPFKQCLPTPEQLERKSAHLGGAPHQLFRRQQPEQH